MFLEGFREGIYALQASSLISNEISMRPLSVSQMGAPTSHCALASILASNLPCFGVFRVGSITFARCFAKSFIVIHVRMIDRTLIPRGSITW